MSHCSINIYLHLGFFFRRFSFRYWSDVDIEMMVQITYNKLLHADKLLAALAIYR